MGSLQLRELGEGEVLRTVLVGEGDAEAAGLPPPQAARKTLASKATGAAAGANLPTLLKTRLLNQGYERE